MQVPKTFSLKDSLSKIIIIIMISKSIVFIYSVEDHSFTVGGSVMAEYPREGHL